MNDFAAQPDDAVDRWLTDQRRAVIADLATTLDLDAGLREATIPTLHTDLVADLREVLDVEAGLSSILPTTPVGSSERDPSSSQRLHRGRPTKCRPGWSFLGRAEVVVHDAMAAELDGAD